MKYCTSCGSEIAEDTIFCPSCGNQVKEVENPKDEPLKKTGNEIKEQLTHTYENTKEMVQKSGYFDYFVETLKRPTAALDSSGSTNGWIHTLVFIFVATISMYGMMSGLLKIAVNEMSYLSFMGIDRGLFSLLRSQLIPRLFFLSLITYFTFVLATFAILKIAGDFKRSFSELLTEFSGLFTINIVVLSPLAVLTFLFSSEVTIGLLGMAVLLTFLLLFAAYNFYLYSRIGVEKLDKMHALVLSNLLVIIILLFLVYIQIEPIITLLDDIGRF